MFSDELKNISWDETTQRIASMTDADVRRALSKSRCDVNDFMALLSPAAEPYLEQMARLSRRYTEERFGRTMSIISEPQLSQLDDVSSLIFTCRQSGQIRPAIVPQG